MGKRTEETAAVAVAEEEPGASGWKVIERRHLELKRQQEERLPRVQEELAAIETERVKIENHKAHLQRELGRQQRELYEALQVQAALEAAGEDSGEARARVDEIRQEQLKLQAALEDPEIPARLEALLARKHALWEEQDTLKKAPTTFLEQHRRQLGDQVRELSQKIGQMQQTLTHTLRTPPSFGSTGEILIFYQRVNKMELELQKLQARLKEAELKWRPVEKLVQEAAGRR